MRAFVPLLMIPFLAACQAAPFLGSPEGQGPAPLSDPEAAGEPYSSTGEPWDLRPRARDEAPGPQASGLLGTSVASLGAASEPGLWVKTPLVSAVQPGRVKVLSSGRELRLELRPTEGETGAGARLSLQAMQGLGLGLTALPEIEIYGG